MPRFRQRPEGSEWGRFGEDDEWGRLNLLTPEKVRQGVAEVREGRTFCLSLPLDLPGRSVLNPRRRPPELFATAREGRPNYLYRLACENPEWTDVVCDDAVVLCNQYSSQWDTFAHVGLMFDADGDGEPEPVFYNGFRGGEDIVAPAATPSGPHGWFPGCYAHRLSAARMAERPIQGRAVLVDLHRHFGDEPALVDGATLLEVMERDGVEVEPGDILCLHTGFARLLVEWAGNPDPRRVHVACAALDGRDPLLLEWITKSDIAALVADNYAVERLPARTGGPGPHAGMPLHRHCLAYLGLPLGELWYLTELAARLREAGRSRFLLTAPPLRLPGAVGSPVSPVATV